MKAEIVENMPEADYHAVKALSASGIKKLIVSIPEFLEEEPEDDTYAKTLGRAYHKLILEGREKFDTSYYCPPFDPESVEGLLKTKDDYVAYAEMIGADFKKSQTKDVIGAAIETVNPDAPFYETVKEAYYKGRAALNLDDYNRLNYFYNLVENSRIGERLRKNKREVSVFWTEDDIPCKARFDAVSEDENYIFDLKTFTNPSRVPPERHIPRVIINQGYHIQAAFYTRAYNAFYQYKHKEEPRFFFLFLQTKGGKAAFPYHLLMDDPEYGCRSAAFTVADRAIETAKTRYRQILDGYTPHIPHGAEPLSDKNFFFLGGQNV